MIKGVNKKIIEINEYESPTFEKASLFLKPTAKNYSENGLKKEAKKYLKSLEENKTNSEISRKRRKNLLIKNRIVFGIIGAFLTTIIFMILNLIN